MKYTRIIAVSLAVLAAIWTVGGCSDDSSPTQGQAAGGKKAGGAGGATGGALNPGGTGGAINLAGVGGG